MPIFKGTFIFNQGRNGWSEVYYVDTDGYDNAKARFARLSRSRAGLLGKGTSIDGVRVSDESVLNDAYPVDVGDVVTFDATTDTPWNSIYVRAQAGALYRRQFHLRGVPDSWITIDPATGKGVIPAVARQQFNLWAADCTSFAPVLQLKVMTKTNDAVKIAGNPVQDGVFTKFSVGAVPGLDAVPYVLLRKWKGPDRKILNRRWDVVKYEAPFVTLSLPWAYLREPTLDYNGFMLRRIPGFAPMTDLFLVRFAAKKTGRAFFVSAGKAPARKDPVTGEPPPFRITSGMP